MGFFAGLTKTLVDVALLPIAVVVDVVTLGGALDYQEQPYTVSAVEEVARDFKSIFTEN